MTSEFPDIRYADAGGVSIAYALSGDGPVDLVRVPDVMSGILVGLVDRWVAGFNERLSRFSRLVRLDRRGLGLSDPLVSGAVPPLEQQVDDVLAVMDAVGIERAALHGGGDGDRWRSSSPRRTPSVSARSSSTARSHARTGHASTRTAATASRGRATSTACARTGAISIVPGVSRPSPRAVRTRRA